MMTLKRFTTTSLLPSVLTSASSSSCSISSCSTSSCSTSSLTTRYYTSRSTTSLSMTDTMMDAFSYTPPTPSFPTSSSYIPRTPGQRTYAIGDVHGDLTKLVMALVKAGLVEQKVREGEDKENATLSDFVWSGGDS